MDKILKKYKHFSEFTFTSNDVLTKVCNAPKTGAGVYIVYQVDKKNTESLVYIGKSGTLYQSETWSAQLLYGRINNTVGKIKREVFWKNMIMQHKLKHLRVEWYVTFDDSIKHIPAYVEALLLQEYYSKYRSIPAWNFQF
jgi:hypothetical protein